jgi:hypothetical protein
MEPRRYEIRPSAAATAALTVVDHRESLSPDDDLVDIGLRMVDGSLGIIAAFSRAELEQLRAVLDEITDWTP